LLKHAGLVIAEKEGQYISYTVNTTVMDEMISWLMQFNKKKKRK
jgi:ArsR family transcriptional regulator